MPLLKNGKTVADPWLRVADGDHLPSDKPVIVPFERWKAERETLLGRNAPVGVRLANTHSVAELAPDLDRLDIIELEFPKFLDGRAYSQARLLRERYGYRNELRATGDVLRDQLLLMERCGFDAFEIADPGAEQAWRAAVDEFSVFYQPAADTRATVTEKRRQP